MKIPKTSRPSNLSIFISLAAIILSQTVQHTYYTGDDRAVPPLLQSISNVLSVFALLVSRRKKEKKNEDPFISTALQTPPPQLEVYSKPEGNNGVPETVQPDIPQRFQLSESKFKDSLEPA